MTWKARPSRAFFLTARTRMENPKGTVSNTGRENLPFPFGPRNRPAVWKVLISAVRKEMHGTSPSASSRVRASLSSAAFAPRAANCVYLLADWRRWGCALCIGNPRAPPLVGRTRIVGVHGRFRWALPGEGDVLCSAGRHGARPNSKPRVECGQNRASCSRSGAAIIRRCSQSAGRTHPQTRGEPGHSATSARPHAESHSSIGARRYPPRLNSDFGALCGGAGRVNRGSVPDTGHPIRCKRATVQCWTAEEGAEDESPCEPSSQRARE